RSAAAACKEETRVDTRWNHCPRRYTLSRYSHGLVTSARGICFAEIRDDRTGRAPMHPTTDTKQSDQRRVTSSHADEEQGEIRQRGPLVLGDMTAHVTADAIPADAIIPRRQTVDAHAGQTHPDPDADGAASRIAERPASIQQPFSRLNHDARHPARQSRDRPWLRGLIVLFIAAGVGAAAFISQSPLRDAAARWAPQVVSASSPPSARPVDVNSLATQAQV